MSDIVIKDFDEVESLLSKEQRMRVVEKLRQILKEPALPDAIPHVEKTEDDYLDDVNIDEIEYGE